jgi:trimeric autotransporter adhesin
LRTLLKNQQQCLEYICANLVNEYIDICLVQERACMRFQRTLIGGGALLSLLRPLWYVIALVFFGQGVGLLPAWAAPAPTITTLSVTSGGNAVTTVAPGSVVTLTATVMADSTPVTPGQVNFCDATAKFCTDIHLLGTAQLTANGTATLKFRPGVGSHSYKAVLAEPAGLRPSASTASSLTVTASQGTGQLATTTYLEAAGVPNIYSLIARVPGDGNTLPTGKVSFVDASKGNAVLGTAALTSETGAGFAGSSLFPVASQNSGNTVLTADFNRDGIPDLVILGSAISVLLGNGDGTFTAAPNPRSDLPGAIAVGDFNGDGIPDLAVAPVLDEGNSEVLLGKGDGTFTNANGGFGIGAGTVTSDSIAVGDFNGDGKLDLVEACTSLNEQPCNLLLIQYGNGDGTFTSSFYPLAFLGSQSMVVGDFNGDGKPDLAVTNSGANGVNVFLNSESGFSAMAASPATGDSPTSVAAADFNGDGKLDLAVTNSGSNNVTILLGNGDGTFTAAASPATGTAPNSLAVADFNGDGVPDLAVANAGSSNVTILLGNDDGTFTAAASPAADTGSTSVAAADFNGDGKEDLVVANSRDSSATALLAETALTIATVNNISPVGVGTHLVKAIYSGDDNYGGSTSADVSLIVVPPGLTLSDTPVSVVAGATGSSTLTITPTNGFSGTVTLACDGAASSGSANDLPTCSSIPPVTISGSAPATITLSIQTQPGTTPGDYTEFVNAVDSSGAIVANTNTARVAVTVTAPPPPPPPSFALTNTTVSIATPGASGTSTITISPSGGYTGSVALSCTVTGPTNAVDLPTCSIAAPPAIKGTAAVTATLTVNTTAASSSSNATGQAATAFRNQHNGMLALGGGGALVAFLFFGVPSRRYRTNTMLSLLLFGAFAPIVTGCGGAQKAANPVTPPTSPVMTPANPGTTAGSYMVTVTGSSGALTASTTVAVTVN